MPFGRSPSCRALSAEPVRGKMQMARMISKQTRKATVAYVEYKHSRTVGLQYLSCYVALILGLLSTIAYIIMTMHVFIRNIAGDDSTLQGVLYLASPTCASVPVTSCHLHCTDTFAWSQGCPFMTGTTVYNVSLL